jgi:hypothetical protein
VAGAVATKDSQFEEGVGDLQHENVGMPVIMHHQDAFYSPPHAEVFIVVL